VSELSDEQLRSFAERGYTVVPSVLSPPLSNAALAAIDRLVDRNPPPKDQRGFHFYWLDDLTHTDPFLALLMDSGAADIVKS
jgi:hypothetical protein